jgi:hypothetical protein
MDWRDGTTLACRALSQGWLLSATRDTSEPFRDLALDHAVDDATLCGGLGSLTTGP